MKKFTNPLMKLSAAVVTFLTTSSAFAQTEDFTNVATKAGSNIYAATNIISTASYVFGAGMTIAGIRGFQAHAENAGSMPIHKPLTKVFVGAAAVAAPWVVNTAFNSAGITETTTVGVTGSSNRL